MVRNGNSLLFQRMYIDNPINKGNQEVDYGRKSLLILLELFDHKSFLFRYNSNTPKTIIYFEVPKNNYIL